LFNDRHHPRRRRRSRGKKVRLPFSKRTLLMVGAAVAIAVGGATLILMPRNTVSTEAAYVQADSSSVAPKVRGLIAEVLVAHNQAVKKGDRWSASTPRSSTPASPRPRPICRTPRLRCWPPTPP
jgi:hypothetical protein